MQIFTVQYDEAEWISAITRQAIQHAQGLQHRGAKGGGNGATKVLLVSLDVYLQSAVAVDWGLSRGGYSFNGKTAANLRDRFYEDPTSSQSQSSLDTHKGTPDFTNIWKENTKGYLQAQCSKSARNSASYDAPYANAEQTMKPSNIEAESLLDIMDLLTTPLDQTYDSLCLEPLESVPALTLGASTVSVTDLVLWDSDG
ncbi:hypothetical protein G7Z17_g501 [Cylindrodendrum hubeiense]|uniref:Uncharacterized protein n=1 Tax=Cylindrodendrum hubeiense TaxID=595255 RepID=A0A9P5HPW0_9HYPO|nr:hypothetical protein G7Z17_g501 [Cylindrodendrum hubeiense]